MVTQSLIEVVEGRTSGVSCVYSIATRHAQHFSMRIKLQIQIAPTTRFEDSLPHTVVRVIPTKYHTVLLICVNWLSNVPESTIFHARAHARTRKDMAYAQAGANAHV